MDPSTTPGTATTPSSSLLESTVNSILGLKSTAVTQDAAATAASTQAAGYEAESVAYGNAAEASGQNAILAGVIGEVKSYQEERAGAVSRGTAVAQNAASGFGAAGSNLDILRSSLQQSYLADQLISTQTALTEGGYLSEAAAARAQKTAADATAAAARTTATALTNASALSTANAASSTAALNKFLLTSTLTDDQKLILSPLGTDITKTSEAVTPMTYLNKTRAKTTNGALRGSGTTTDPFIYGNKF